MNPADLADTDLVTLPGAHDAPETVERLKAMVTPKGIEVFAHIDTPPGQGLWGCRYGRPKCRSSAPRRRARR
jgi:hypothetical protein